MENRIDYGTLDLHHIFGNLEAPDLNGKEKSKDEKLAGNDAPDFSLAYLGPQIWPTNGESDDFKLEPINLDDLLDESTLNEGLGEITTILGEEILTDNAESPVSQNQKASEEPCLALTIYPQANQTHQPDPQDDDEAEEKRLAGKTFHYQPNITEMMISTPLEEDDTTNELFDPRTRTFTEDELKPQPIIRKAKKVYVPSESKDARYWHKREKNNAAAKRSREARRIKENQIVMRTKFLESENDGLRVEVTDLRAEVTRLMQVVEEYKRKEMNQI